MDLTDLPDQEIYLPNDYTDPHTFLDSATKFISGFDRLINMHITNFMTHNQWTYIPKEWREALLPNENDDYDWISRLVDLASANMSVDIWPESLKEYINTTEKLSLSRESLPGYDTQCTIDKLIRLGMTEKKIHEVGPMSTVIQHVAHRRQVESVMDLGAGQGYLSRTLAYQHNLNVLAVDGSEVQTCGAKWFDKHLLKSRRPNANLNHVTDMVTPANVSTILAKWSKKQDQEENIAAEEEDEKWLVCGLHACGDLSSLMLRLFIQSDTIVSLVNVGCCYHFLTEEPYESAGFPLSKYLKVQQQYRMGSTAHMLACQTPCRWSDKREETLSSFEHHFYRALLQYIMVEKGLAQVNSPPVIGRLNKKKDFLSFPIYVRAALKRLKVPENSITDNEAETYYAEAKANQVDKQIAILWTVRILLGPILESIILTDRWLYLKEQLADLPESKTKGVWMWPLFDPITSPRNMVIVASK
ncbi:methyltransferase domain-containing protein [Circinella umbellata]|nr:methyltransferase domain-containing protein [Circinella umbellata]